jgi:hypothetical protein
LRENSRSEAFEAVLQIGAPAVPFIARHGLHDKGHKFHFLAWDHVYYFCTNHPRLSRWLRIDSWLGRDNCVGRHDQARLPLSCMGTNAQTAIPDVIDCLEHCPSLHFINAQDLPDTLGDISGTNLDPRLAPRDRESVMFELESRTNDATATIARLLALQTKAPVQVK